MRQNLVTRILFIVFCALLATGCDQLAMRNVESAERSETVTSIGTIRDIDVENRRLQLRMDGSLMTLRVNEAVAGFDIARVGDRVRVTHTEAVAVQMASPTDTGEVQVDTSEAILAGRGTIGRAGAGVVSGVFEFVSFDRATSTVTLIGPEGNRIAVEVAPELRDFARSRGAGERIVVNYAFGTALQLEFVS